jgi:hypothetical protein
MPEHSSSPWNEVSRERRASMTLCVRSWSTPAHSGSARGRVRGSARAGRVHEDRGCREGRQEARGEEERGDESHASDPEDQHRKARGGDQARRDEDGGRSASRASPKATTSARSPRVSPPPRSSPRRRPPESRSRWSSSTRCGAARRSLHPRRRGRRRSPPATPRRTSSPRRPTRRSLRNSRRSPRRRGTRTRPSRLFSAPSPPRSGSLALSPFCTSNAPRWSPRARRLKVEFRRDSRWSRSGVQERFHLVREDDRIIAVAVGKAVSRLGHEDVVVLVLDTRDAVGHGTAVVEQASCPPRTGAGLLGALGHGPPAFVAAGNGAWPRARPRGVRGALPGTPEASRVCSFGSRA